MSKRYTTAQLNAISRSKIERARKAARAELLANYNIKYDEFAVMHAYQGGPCRLLTDIRYQKASTLEKVRQYYKESGSYVPQSLGI